MAETFAALRIDVPGDYSTLGVKQVPFPELAEGQVLIKTEYSTINPSDVYTAAGLYPVGSFPLTIGLEGCGTVVKSGGGQVADSLLNKRVSFAYKESWAEYVLAPVGAVFPLLDSVPFEKAASLVVNPITVALFIEVIEKNKHVAVVQNGAASALGKILLRWSLHSNIPLINIVRRQEQVELLKSLGAEHVFNSSEEGWKDKAKELATKLNVTIGFDCVGGTGTSDLADLIVDGGVVYNYGLLSGQPTQFGSNHLIFQRKRLEGLWLTPWLHQKSNEEKEEIGYKVQNLLDQVFKTEYSKEVTLSQVKEALIEYSQNSTNNKILIKTVV